MFDEIHTLQTPAEELVST